MSHSEAFVDIHCHLLPGLDDGPSGRDEALAMAEMAVADGVGTIIATPHQLGNFTPQLGHDDSRGDSPFSATARPAADAVAGAAGADVRIEPDLVPKNSPAMRFSRWPTAAATCFWSCRTTFMFRWIACSRS